MVMFEIVHTSSRWRAMKGLLGERFGCPIAKIERAKPNYATAQEVEEFRLDGDGFLIV